jgi:hypothetical protein
MFTEVCGGPKFVTPKDTSFLGAFQVIRLEAKEPRALDIQCLQFGIADIREAQRLQESERLVKFL